MAWTDPIRPTERGEGLGDDGGRTATGTAAAVPEASTACWQTKWLYQIRCGRSIDTSQGRGLKGGGTTYNISKCCLLSRRPLRVKK